MKKVYLCIALCVMLLAALSINAQRNMFVRGDNGSVNAVEVSNVDYATIHPKLDSWFHISNYGAVFKSSTSIKADFAFTAPLESEVKSLSCKPEIGVCYSSENKTPTVADQCKVLGLAVIGKLYEYTLESLKENTTYYLRPYMKLANTIFYGDVAEAETMDDRSCVINGHKFVDLHLPSGTLWAETNIGAEASADDGYYFAWGEISPQESMTYSWDTYKWGVNNTKYGNGSVLDKEDDAAYANWGDPCRMPTKEEFEELINTDNCTWSWISVQYSGTIVFGWRCKSVKNGHSIFFPVPGWYEDGKHYNSNKFARYLCTNYDYALMFDKAYPLLYKYFGRYWGMSIRPVAKLE